MDRQAISFELGERLKELRIEHDLSHETLIKQLNEKYGISLSRDSIMAYEIADESRAKAHKLPNLSMRVETLYCLADFYGVSLDYLLGRTDTPVADMDTRDICEQTGLSVESVQALKSPPPANDFLLLFINNLIRQVYSFQAPARMAARYWIQGEIGEEAKSKEELWFERTLCFEHQEDILRKSERVSPFAEIPAKDAGDFYRDRAVRAVERIVSRSIEEYMDTFKATIDELRELPDDLVEELDFMKRLYLLASNAALKDVMGDEFKGVPELNELEAELNDIRAKREKNPPPTENK